MSTTVERIEAALRRTLTSDAKSLLDERVIAHQAGVTETDVEDLLVELVDLGALSTHFVWECPNKYGVAAEADKLEDLPHEIDCGGCGQVHTFSQDDIDVKFLPTDELLQAVHAS